MRDSTRTFLRPRPVKRLTAAGVSTVLAGSLLGACADDGGSGSSTGDDGKGKTTVTVGVFGVFGYKQAGTLQGVREVPPRHPHPGERHRAQRGLLPRAAQPPLGGQRTLRHPGGRGRQHQRAGDRPGRQVHRLRHGPGVRQRATGWTGRGTRPRAKDGKVIGLGTDIGPMAICYRKDLFKKAGLPTGRGRGGQAVGGRLAEVRGRRRAVQEEGAQGRELHRRRRGPLNASALQPRAQVLRRPAASSTTRRATRVRRAWDLAMRAVKDR